MKTVVLGMARSHKFYFLTSLILTPIFLFFFVTSIMPVQASFGSWGDTSLVHGCKDGRGRLTVVDSTGSCNQNETQTTWLKDVDAGSGLSISRSSTGATLSFSGSIDTSHLVDGAVTQAKAPFAIKGDVNNMRVERGQITATLSSAQIGSQTITFNTSFNSAPTVLLQVDGAGVNWGYDYIAITDSCSASSCTVRYKYLPGSTTETALRINWVAIGN